MVRLGNLLKRTLAPAALCALALAACGSQQKPQPASTTITGTTTTATTATTDKPPVRNPYLVTIYSSLPTRGPQRSQGLAIQDGIGLALNLLPDRKAGKFRITYVHLPDSPAPPPPAGRHRVGPDTPSTNDRSSARNSTTTAVDSGGWDPGRTVNNAEKAASNPHTIAYIGDLDSGATELSLPILNQAGIAQITPGSAYPGLTDAYKGITQQGPPPEPDRYYPQNTRTLLRLIPSDIVQASAALAVLRGQTCTKVAIWDFPLAATIETQALANAVKLTAAKYGMAVLPTPPLNNNTSAYKAYAYHLRGQIQCAILVGHSDQPAKVLAAELRYQAGVPVLGTAGFCDAGWAKGAAAVLTKVSKTAAEQALAGLYCTSPALPVRSDLYPDHKVFILQFRRRYHRSPTAYAYYGYESAEMVIRALKDIQSGDDNDRQEVLTSISDGFPTDTRPAPVTFDNGDVTSRAYGLYYYRAGVRTFRLVMPREADLLSSDG